ncbi:MAG: RluA family pseudouridine synthase [Candidatus Sumerlaeota bacterium]
MSTRKLPYPAEPTTLLPHLIAVLKETKRTRVKEILRAGLVHVEGESVTRHDHPVEPGQLIEIRDERLPPARVLPFTVLYEDATILAINKPCGLLTIATATEKSKTVYSIVNQALASTRERAFVVHRLDRFTSGVLLLAKSEEAKIQIMGNWEEAHKTYHAVVEGTPKPATKKLIHHLREDERLVVHAMDGPTKNSQRAVLTYKVISSNREHALLEIDLDTGKKNQIRAQLSAIGHPIAGDPKYGAKTDPIKRLALHASTLSIPHPLTKERLSFEAPMPLEMKIGRA